MVGQFYPSAQMVFFSSSKNIITQNGLSYLSYSGVETRNQETTIVHQQFSHLLVFLCSHQERSSVHTIRLILPIYTYRH